MSIAVEKNIKIGIQLDAHSGCLIIFELLSSHFQRKLSMGNRKDVCIFSLYSPIFARFAETHMSMLFLQLGVGQINSVWGRGWGKDRDNRWKRIEAAYRSLTEGTAGVHVQLDAKSSL